MRLAYIDESYTRDFYFIGAVVVDDVSAPALERALDEVAERARTTYLPDVAAPLELHGNPMFQGSKEWAPVKQQIRALISIYEQAMRAIGSQDLHIFLHRRRSTITETNPKQAQAIERLWSHVTGRIRHQLISCP